MHITVEKNLYGLLDFPATRGNCRWKSLPYGRCMPAAAFPRGMDESNL
jgi:hypothetical protein